MLDLLFYLGVGGLNAAVAGAQGRLMILHYRDRAALIEVAFYVLLWPVQLIFWTFVRISNSIDWLGFHLMGGSSRRRRPKHRA